MSERSTNAEVDGAAIAVVVPTFNDAERLGDALRSIAGQTVSPSEIVVADDGSTDATERFVREFAEREAGRVPVRYIKLASRSGVVAARNAGIAATQSAWIATCDSDDIWAPNKLERQIGFLRDWQGERIALLGTHGFNVNDAKRIISPAQMGPTSEREYESLQRTGRAFYFLHSSLLYPRTDFLAVGGYSMEYGAADDFEFFCRMAERGVAIVVTEPLVYYRKRAGSVQLARFWDKLLGELRIIENQRRRAAGEALVGREEFEAELAAAPLPERLTRRRRALGMYFYRSGAAQMVNGRRLRGGARLLLSSVLDWKRLRAGTLNALRARRGPREPA
jgi:glycosyltransferase involved in cell wall biosynthesis